ncbi:hypothetical protein HDV00_006321 [Rhizophlyctis rosea]|nr:hypothetical protein HDV00_006321 [Rhizophlyctis rosea]
MAEPQPAAPPSLKAVDDSIRQFQLVSTLRTADPDSATTAIRTLCIPPPPATQTSYGSPLHLAVSLCPRAVVERVFSTFCTLAPTERLEGDAKAKGWEWLNAKNEDGDTPLHLVAKNGRGDLVEVLLKSDRVDDTLRNKDGKTAEDVAKNDKVAEILLAQRTLYTQTITSKILHLLNTASYSSIIDLFSTDQRAAAYLTMGWIDINAPIDPTTEQSILHFAAKADHVELVDWALSHGADPGVKDKKGKKPAEVGRGKRVLRMLQLCPKKDSRTKERLKRAIAQAPIISPSLATATATTHTSTSLTHPHTTAPPTLTGTLFKWTNYAAGYKSRYFVLENGNLSYFKSPPDYPLACRGSMATMIANIVMPDSADKSRFDVLARGVRWSLKARSPADAKKWVWALMEWKKWGLDRSKGGGSSAGVSPSASAGKVAEEEGDEWGVGEEDGESDAGTEVAVTASAESVVGEVGEGVSGRSSVESGVRADGAAGAASHGSLATSVVGVPDSPKKEPVKEKEKDVHTTMTGDFRTLCYLLNVQMDVQQRVVEAVVGVLQEREKERIRTGTTKPRSGSDASVTSTSTTGATFLHDVDLSNLPSLLESSSKHVQDTMGKLVSLAEGREKLWQRRWKKELESRRRWEEVVRKVVGVEGVDAMDFGGGVKSGVGGGEVVRESMESVAGSGTGVGQESDVDEEEEEEEGGDDVFYDAEEAGSSAGASGNSGFVEQVLGFEEIQDVPEDRASLDLRRTTTKKSLTPVIPDRSATPSSSALVSTKDGQLLSAEELKSSLVGYSAVQRKKLPLDPTLPKPTLAVWSFLKSAIGKDLSKVTLPVFFNEPLSMLQRMCEDIEYIELLSLASRIGCKNSPSPSSDLGTGIAPARLAASHLGVDLSILEGLEGEDASLVRGMYVAAYAMSNYSSTVGRCNKPFNPMLGETYELVREDKECRYLSEQPISACYCDSPSYTFWTEVNVKSKFWGKSLELHPLGTCHVRLPLPNNSAETEHYSWKKVTTAVNNLIVGKLWIDHYGDMRVKNWRTGEEVVITFKPKGGGGGGWFGGGGKKGVDAGGEDAGGGEISGVVKDSKGEVRWEIFGRWDGEVLARPVGRYGERVRKAGLSVPLGLWKRFPVPADAAENFNFTEFAVGMNELSPELRRVLPPTDSRLRPDQEAMERGAWDLANTGKEKLETYQRLRRTRIVQEYERTGRPSGPSVDEQPERGDGGEEMGEKWWVPRWFVREVEGDTGEGHWRFVGDYWGKRRGVVEGRAGWPGYVVDVFGE